MERFGAYAVFEQLGAGGMASVHRAEAVGIEGFRRPVALKRMLPHLATHPTLVKSFIHEAWLASQLRHENVAQTYDLGKVDDVYFMAMELVAGQTVREILKRTATLGVRMPVPIALNLVNQLCDALDYAHNLCDEGGQPLGIVHRDVSPSNLIVQAGTGIMKLIDFGVAKAVTSGVRTQRGVIKGKFAYMAPEYLSGQLDARADLWAVGVIAHELLANQPLFACKQEERTIQRLKTLSIEPPSRQNPEVPAAIDEIVLTALSRDPECRWQTATALRNAMTTVTRQLGLVATNRQVSEWVQSLFAVAVRSSAPEIPATAPDLSVEIEIVHPACVSQVATRVERLFSPVRARGTGANDALSGPSAKLASSSNALTAQGTQPISASAVIAQAASSSAALTVEAAPSPQPTPSPQAPIERYRGRWLAVLVILLGLSAAFWCYLALTNVG